MHDAEADQGRQGWENLVVRTAPQFLLENWLSCKFNLELLINPSTRIRRTKLKTN